MEKSGWQEQPRLLLLDDDIDAVAENLPALAERGWSPDHIMVLLIGADVKAHAKEIASLQSIGVCVVTSFANNDPLIDLQSILADGFGVFACDGSLYREDFPTLRGWEMKVEGWEIITDCLIISF